MSTKRHRFPGLGARHRAVLERQRERDSYVFRPLGKLAILVGPSARLPISSPDLGGNEADSAGPDGNGITLELGATLAGRLPHGFAIGVHVDKARRAYRAFSEGTAFGNDYIYHVDLLDLALAFQYEPDVLDGRVALGAWLGGRFASTTLEDTRCRNDATDPAAACMNPATATDSAARTVLGFTASVDVVGTPTDHLAVFAELQLDGGDGSALGLGIAYRR
jgi:hypothetical protein